LALSLQLNHLNQFQRKEEIMEKMKDNKFMERQT
jgi:hypothetical protein